MRLRIGSQAEAVAEPTGPSDGEIEDYRVSFEDRELAGLPDLRLTKTVAPNRMTQVGEELTYALVTTNTGTVPLSDVRMTDELPGLTDLLLRSGHAGGPRTGRQTLLYGHPDRDAGRPGLRFDQQHRPGVGRGSGR